MRYHFNESVEHCAIAIIDGDRDSREMAASVLGNDDVDLCLYDNAENFLPSLAEHAYSCLVIEADLPGMSGLELQRYLHAVGTRTPVVIYSASCDMVTARHALEAGAIEFFTKPLDAQLLRQAVCEATAMHRPPTDSPLHRHAA